MGDRAYSHREGLVKQTWFGNSQTVLVSPPITGFWSFADSALNNLLPTEGLLPWGGYLTKEDPPTISN